jgi:hypothetical protein
VLLAQVNAAYARKLHAGLERDNHPLSKCAASAPMVAPRAVRAVASTSAGARSRAGALRWYDYAERLVAALVRHKNGLAGRRGHNRLPAHGTGSGSGIQ